MTDIVAKVISDCIATVPAPRLFTVETRAPCMIHQEVLRHRRIITEEGLSVLGLGWEPDFSFSVSSTRAVPFAKMLEECRDPKLAASPTHWGRAQKGMVPGDEIDDTEKCVNWGDVIRRMPLTGVTVPYGERMITKREAAKRIWDLHGDISAGLAELMVEVADPHKSIPNRMMQPHLHYNVLMTGTEPGWLNFFGLRLDGAADPIVRALAEQNWIQWNESKPRTLKPGEWAFPYADDEKSFNEAIIEAEKYYASVGPSCEQFILETQQKMSVARCAHLSYTSFETGERMTVEQCLNLYQRLVGSVPIHASPAEHQATPDTYDFNADLGYIWEEPYKGGNLGPGWIQLRKLLPNEDKAPIPEKYL